MKAIRYTILLLFFAFTSVHGETLQELVAQYEPVLCELPGWDHDKVVISEIGGGATNRNYIVKIEDQVYFLREGSSNDLLGNSIEREYFCGNYASEQGISPEVVLYVPEKRILVTRFIKTQGNPLDVKEVETLNRITASIRALHSSDKEIPFELNPFAVIKDYRAKLQVLNVKLPEKATAEWFAAMDEIEKAISGKYAACICHMDLHKGNFLDDGKTIWLIDWEYAGMGNPFFDLSTFAAADHFTDEEMRSLLKAYKPDFTENDFAHLYLMRIMADARWALWAFIQNEMSDLDVDFEAMGQEFLRDSMERVFSEKFQAMLHKASL